MMGRTHIAAAAAVSMTYLSFADPNAVAGIWDLLYIAVPVTATMLPDIDCEDSYISTRCKLTKCVSILVQDYLGHRGILHTPFFVAILAGIFFVWNQFLAQEALWQVLTLYLGKAFVFGYALHLLLDLFTPMGIMVFYPFSKEYYTMAPTNVYDRRKELRLFSGLFIYNFMLLITH